MEDMQRHKGEDDRHPRDSGRRCSVGRRLRRGRGRLLQSDEALAVLALLGIAAVGGAVAVPDMQNASIEKLRGDAYGPPDMVR